MRHSEPPTPIELFSRPLANLVGSAYPALFPAHEGLHLPEHLDLPAGTDEETKCHASKISLGNMFL